VWVNAYIVEGDTEADAQAYLDYYANTHGDWEAATNLVTNMIGSSESYAKETMDQMKFHFIAGWGGYPIVGTQAQVVDSLSALSKSGLDGVLLSFPRYIEDMRRFQQSTYPLLVEAGLR
jgi:FMNH2-dependent dimethyl sulfone monooxygenase